MQIYFHVILPLVLHIVIPMEAVGSSSQLESSKYPIENENRVAGKELSKKSEELLSTDLLQKIVWHDFIASVNYEKPSKYQLDLATRLFTILLSTGKVSGNESSEWTSLGFSFEEFPGNLAIISELTPNGHGCYIVKLNADGQDGHRSESESLILQAPHTLSDLLTDAIAMQLFLEGDFSAVALSTRYRKSVDLAKETDSFFNSFTKAAATAFLSTRVIQLHGFDPQRHFLELKDSCDLILSPSATIADKEIFYDNIANSLTERFKDFKICLFPRDVSVLGGLRNINAKVFYAHANNPLASFCHVETSFRMREALTNSQHLRKMLIESFIHN